jgi:hypothetical protein
MNNDPMIAFCHAASQLYHARTSTSEIEILLEKSEIFIEYYYDSSEPDPSQASNSQSSQEP